MKFRVLSLPILFFAMMFSCQAQNGPTQPSVLLTWTQSATPGVTANCVYRGTTAGVYALPAIFCSTAPITSYKDTSVQRGQTYQYGVTAKISATEGPYSNNVQAVIPQAPAAPALNTPSTITDITKSSPLTPRVSNLEAKVEWTKEKNVR